MAELVALYSALGSLVVALGYVLVKRLSRSNCESHTDCCECSSPALELQKEHTGRLENLEKTIETLVNRLEPDLGTPVTPL